MPTCDIPYKKQFPPIPAVASLFSGPLGGYLIKRWECKKTPWVLYTCKESPTKIVIHNTKYHSLQIVDFSNYPELNYGGRKIPILVKDMLYKLAYYMLNHKEI